MSPIRHLHRDDQVSHGDLYWIGLDLAVEGTVLALAIWTIRGFDGLTATVIAVFLAGMFIVRMTVGAYDNLRQTLYARLACTLFVVLFSGWLLYEGKTARSGWYRSHVIQDRIHRIVSDAPATILVSDIYGRITEVSRELAKTLGYTREELIGKEFKRLIPRQRWPELDVRLAEARKRLTGARPEEAGWLRKGTPTFDIVRKDGTIVKGRTYSGAIRWSESTPFEGDTDVLVVFVPTEEVP